MSESLVYHRRQLGVKKAFQVVQKLPYQAVDYFDYDELIVVPALTFLSQLV